MATLKLVLCILTGLLGEAYGIKHSHKGLLVVVQH